MSGLRHSRFSPHLVAGEQLDRLYVGRGGLVDQLVADLVSAVGTGGARYELLVGPRGAGKSHLSALVRHRLAKALVDDAIIVALDEEEHVGSLVGLLARLLRRFPDEPGLPSTSDQERALRGFPRGEAVERAVGLMEARLGARALVIFLENLDQLFEDIGREGQQRLRSVLQTHPRWSIVATSRTLAPAFTKPQQPFFHTFAPHVLEPLGAEACRDQLLRLAQADGKTELATFLATQTGLARVHAIHHFTGGNPRAMALVYPYLTREKLDDLVGAFYDLSEELTPYFQEQMARLATGQRPVLEALAENWRPMSPSELAERLYETQATISMQLKRLKDDRLVTSLAVGRERFYEIADPLHRLARAMKRPDRIGEVLARFLRFWYAEPELDRLLERPFPSSRDAHPHMPSLLLADSAVSAPTLVDQLSDVPPNLTAASASLSVLVRRPGDALMLAFPSGAPHAWRVPAALAANVRLGAAAARSPETLTQLNRLDAFFNLGDSIAIGRAIAALPTTTVPWARLAAEERAVARQILERGYATDLLARVPDEPTTG